jgi:cytochrome c oxidase assembly factor CtaG
VLAGVLYARRASKLAHQRRALPRRRQACFYGGLAVIAVAILALDHAARVSVAWRTVQLLLMGEIATLLIVLGLTLPLLAPLLRGTTGRRLRLLASPALAFSLWALNLYLWHLSALYQGALEHDGIQLLEHLCFVAFGINMWMCLFGPLPVPRWFNDLAKLAYILAVRVAGIVLANILLWSHAVFYPFYTHPDSARHVSPLVDQNVAGAIMMIEGVLLTLGLFGWLYARTLREGAEPRVFDLARDGGGELAPPRPATAAARRAQLRRRFERSGERAPVPQPEVVDSP